MKRIIIVRLKHYRRLLGKVLTMKSLKKLLKLRVLRYKLRSKNVRLDSDCQVAFDSIFEGNNRIGTHAFFAGSLGYASYVGEQSHVVADIGRFTCIAPRVITVRGSHPSHTWASIHPAFYSKANQCGMSFVNEDRYVERKARTKIGNDVWIGDSVIIMDGITIGDGAIIAAGAVVTKDVSPYSIVGGVPAKVIKYRFSEEEIVRLMELKWWEKPLAWINDNAELFKDVKMLLNRCEV